MLSFFLAFVSADVISLSNVTPRYVCWSSILSGVLPKLIRTGWFSEESVKRVPVSFPPFLMISMFDLDS